MNVKAQRVSKLSDNVTWCLPSDGYDKDNAIDVDLESYREIDTIQNELPPSDKVWPEGAAFTDYVKVGNKIYQKKR